jgi:uncharacterized protein (DUF1778 family)
VKKQPKTRKLEVRLTPDENERLKQSAAEAGVTVSEHVRRRVLSEPARAGLFRSTGLPERLRELA